MKVRTNSFFTWSSYSVTGFEIEVKGDNHIGVQFSNKCNYPSQDVNHIDMCVFSGTNVKQQNEIKGKIQ